MAAVELALVEAADSELETVRAELRASREHRRKLDRHIGVLEKREALLKVRQKPPTREAGSEPGHQTWAIRALEEDGVIEQTGRKVGVSVEYRYAKRRRRTTRLGPGK
jgi:hypothetical protein